MGSSIGEGSPSREELVFCWHRAGQTKLHKSSASLTESSFSSLSLARQFIFTSLSVYTPQVDYPEAVKQRFYDELQHAVAKVQATKIPVGDCNGHVGSDASVYSDAYGWYGCGTHNTESKRVLEFNIANDLCVSNTWFIRGTPILSLTTPVTIQPGLTTYSIAKVSAAQSVT